MRDFFASSARDRVGVCRSLVVVGVAACFLGVIPWHAAEAADGSVVATPSALSAGDNPNFDAVAFLPLVCQPGGDPQGDESPGAVDLVGDASHPPSYYAHDASYLYFRFRVNANPTGSKGFASYSWVILLQVPSGDPFQHQFEIALNGAGADDDFGNTSGQKGDTLEIWKNDPAENVYFSPLFHDSSEIRLFAQRHDYAGPLTANTTPLARIALAADGSAFGGDADYFVDIAVPVSVLIAKGVVTSASQLADALYFPATTTNSNQYNKDHLDCPFLPATNLSITKSVVPSQVPAGVTTGVVHTITVRNDGSAIAKGVVLEDTAFPSSLSGVTMLVTSDDPTVTWAVVTANPLQLKAQRLPQGKSITVRIESNAGFACSTPAFTNTATVWATNAETVTASATLSVATGVAELCDGKDNNCNGQIDEGVTSCNDGNACNGLEMCVAGSCVGGTPLQCIGSNPCIDDSCDPVTGCVHTDAAAGRACNDGNSCTQSDTCQAGSCTGANPVVCEPGDACHVAGTCDPSSGVCSHPNKANGSSCNDGNSCTQTDTCQAGICTGANQVVCTASDACHLAGVCDPSSGVCLNPNKADGSGCDDGDACTQTDACQAGICTGTSYVVCAASDTCHLAGVCDPSSGVCSNPNASDGSGCDDGDACTQTDTCQHGVCTATSYVVCTASDACHVAGVCSPSSGICSNPSKTDGSGCDDGNACTPTDTCQAGTCTGGNPVVCTASDACHVAGVCNPSSGICSNPSKADGSGCSDGNGCTQTDTCQAGVCTGANQVVCTASDACHVTGVCDPSTGVCSNPNKANGSACNDDNACTQADSCQAGTCTGANQVVCTASDTCHVMGVCDPSTGVCSNPSKANGSACSDGNACTQTDSCQAGVCTGTNQVVCTASDTCHVAGLCDPSTGACSNPSKANGSSCSDGNACTSADTCAAGSCVGGPAPSCDDHNFCTNDGCDPATGCTHVNNTAACIDRFLCTTADACRDGSCVGGPPLTPDCQDARTIDVYQRLCAGLHPEDEITLDDVECVNDWSTFALVTSLADVCRVLVPNPSSDKCLQAESQLMAALLNLCAGRLRLGQPIESTCTDHASVRQSLFSTNALLSNAERSDASCMTAQCESDELNSGKAVGSASLLVNRVSGALRISWRQPPTGPGWATPAGYSVWRRPRGIGSFVIIGTVTGLFYDDAGVIPGSDFEYEVTINRP